MATPYCARVAILTESVERGGGAGGGAEAAWLAFGLEAPLGMWARGSYCARGRAWEGTTGEPPPPSCAPPLMRAGARWTRWRFSPEYCGLCLSRAPGEGRKMDEMAILARTCPLWPIPPLRLRSGQGRLREAQLL
jgi:hypothetical protein